jgi:hypothetical protein
MSDRDWTKEMAKIDRQLESVSDAALFPQKADATPAQQAQVAAQRSTTSTWGVLARLSLATALGVAVLFWPYEARCGAGLAGYLAATIVVAIGGIWSAVWSWRHRSARAHVLALLLVVWGGVLTAIEVLPRVGYAKSDALVVPGWVCR